MRDRIGGYAPTPLLIAILLCVFPVPAVACEPLPPLLLFFTALSLLTMPVVGGIGPLAGLAGGIGLKCVAFACFESTLPKGKATGVIA